MIMGAQVLGHASPNFQDFSAARGAAGEIFDTIDRVSLLVVCVCMCVCLTGVQAGASADILMPMFNPMHILQLKLSIFFL